MAWVGEENFSSAYVCMCVCMYVYRFDVVWFMDMNVHVYEVDYCV